MKKICFVTAVPSSAHAFLRDHMKALQKDYKVYYVSNEPDEAKIYVSHDGYHCVNIRRNISLWKDIKALIELYRYFRIEKFDAVHSVTPKAGLLTAVASFFAKVPIRIHIYTGQVWVTKTGVFRWFLKLLDKVIAKLDNHLLVDGEGQRQFLIDNGVLKDSNSRVLGKGSICGVNLERFNPSVETRKNARYELNIDPDRIVFVFMGRLNHDKGLYELLASFNRFAKTRDDIFLLLFGSDEEKVASHFKDYTNLVPKKNFLYYGLTREPQKMLQAGDVFVLPTYREGFGSSVIEASALGLPVICSDAYGVRDAIVDNVTGIRCKVGDEESLYMAMKTFADSREMRQQMGEAGRKRVIEDFDSNRITQLWLDFYHDLLK